MKRIAIAACLFCAIAGRANAQTPRIITVRSVTVPPGSAFVLPVSLDVTDGAEGIDLDIAYDPTLLMATAYAPGPAGEGYSLVCNLNVPGEVRCAFYCAVAPSGGGDILLLMFQAGDATGVSPIHVWHLAIQEGWMPAVAVDGAVTVQAPLLRHKRQTLKSKFPTEVF